MNTVYILFVDVLLLLVFPCFVLFDILVCHLRVIPVNINNYNTASWSMFIYFFFFKLYVNWEPVLIFNQILRSLNDFDHLAWGRGSWFLCLSCVCLLAMHTLICVTFSLPPGVRGWLRPACGSSWTFLFTFL